MSALLDALMAVGAVFDTPGAIVRNTLAGENPFLGLFEPEERTYGRDLLETWGVLDENEEGLDWGDVAGFGVDVVADPLSLLGLGKVGTGLGRAAARYADEAVKAPTLGVFGGALGDFSKYGKKARQLDPEEAMSLYKGWADNLTPEEAEAVRLFTSGPQEGISSTLRGVEPRTPLSDLVPNSQTTAPTINSPERVMNEVVPYLDSAMAKGATPEDIVTYRLSGQLGELTPENARSLIGEVVSDPSYMSTTITPYGRFYGKADTPAKNMLVDILYPEGTPGAFPNAGGLSTYKSELELMTPRNLPMKVLDVQDVPVAKLDYDYFKLTPEGKPIPIPNSNAGSRKLFDEDALYELERQAGFDNPMYPAGTFDTPPNLDDLLVPGWEDVIAQAPKDNFTNVLLEAMPEGLPQIGSPATRRLTREELMEIVEPLFPKAAEDLVSRGIEDSGRMARLLEGVKEGTYSPNVLLRRIQSAGGHSGLEDLLKQSVPKERAIPSMLEILKKAGIPIAGVGGASSPLMNALLSEQAA